jgi:hypothetical protein
MKASLPHNNTATTWSTWGLPDGNSQDQPRRHRIGETDIYTGLDHAGDDAILLMLARPGSAAEAGLALPDCKDSSWLRTYTGKAQRYALLPAYPELPLCIRLRQAFILPPMSSIQGWLYSYINAEIHIGDSRISSFPLKPLYKTLYGTTTSGILCYAIEGKFLTADEPDYQLAERDPSCLAHPVRIKNTTTEAVNIQELCVHASQLSIFQWQGHLFSEKILFTFGQSRVRMSIEGMHHRGKDVLTLADPLISGEDKVIDRSIEVLRALTRMQA